jgi:hypothetical protein
MTKRTKIDDEIDIIGQNAGIDIRSADIWPAFALVIVDPCQ